MNTLIQNSAASNSANALSVKRYRLIAAASIVLAVTFIAALIGRLMLGPLHPFATAFVGLVIFELICVPFLVRGDRHTDIGGSVVLAAFISLLLAVGYVVGGLEGPVLAVLPAVPLVATVMLTPRAGIIATLLVCASVSWFLALHLGGHIFPSYRMDEQGAQILQAIVILLCTMFVAIIAWAYEQRNRAMRGVLEQMAVTDHLTDLPNRRSFDLVLEHKLRAPQSVILMLIDVDNLKVHNDTHGHLAGDECLHLVAESIRKCIGTQHDYAARIAGDEFAIILTGMSNQYAYDLAERLRLTMKTANRSQIRGSDSAVTLSIGIAARDPEETGPDLVGRLFLRADKALYRAKSEGRNRYAMAGGDAVRVEPSPEYEGRSV